MHIILNELYVCEYGTKHRYVGLFFYFLFLGGVGGGVDNLCFDLGLTNR